MTKAEQAKKLMEQIKWMKDNLDSMKSEYGKKFPLNVSSEDDAWEKKSLARSMKELSDQIKTKTEEARTLVKEAQTEEKQRLRIIKKTPNSSVAKQAINWADALYIK